MDYQEIEEECPPGNVEIGFPIHREFPSSHVHRDDIEQSQTNYSHDRVINPAEMKSGRPLFPQYP